MDEALYFDLVSFLRGDILVKVARAAMAHGLETRAPHIGRDAVEFTLSLPSTLKVKNNETKVLFKQALSAYWPKHLQTRGKQGFAGPFATWLDLPEVAAIIRRTLPRVQRSDASCPVFSQSSSTCATIGPRTC
jgi:asparagine synthase (glutamine-hydrolysing)